MGFQMRMIMGGGGMDIVQKQVQKLAPRLRTKPLAPADQLALLSFTGRTITTQHRKKKGRRRDRNY